MKQLVKVFKALSDPNRIRIIKMLEVRPLCVCEITNTLRLATSTVSKHLSLLKEADLIRDKKDGKWIYYHLNEEAAQPYGHLILRAMSNWVNEEKLVRADKAQVLEVSREEACKIYVKQKEMNELTK